MIIAGDVVFCLGVCADFGVTLQRVMSFRLRPMEFLILMSLRPGVLSSAGVEDGGIVILSEGHDVPLTTGVPNPKGIDQPEFLPSGRLTQNGLFADAVRRFKAGRLASGRVKVFEKIRAGIWVYNGLFRLIDVWQETSGRRLVFRFHLEILDQLPGLSAPPIGGIDHDGVIPAAVKVGVWKRD
jgi:hypothetical protein